MAATGAGADFDAYADEYGAAVQRSIEFSGLDHDFFTRRKARYLLDLARRRLGTLRDLRALDVGCGIGGMHPLLAGRFAQLEGVDTSREAIHRAAAANPSVRYRAYDGDSLPYGDGRFDLVFAVCVLHHVPPGERSRFAAELRRVLRPGGMVAVFEHNPLNPLTRLAVRGCEFDADAVLLTAGSVARLLRSAGLRRVERRYVILFPTERRHARAVEGALAALPLGAQHYVAAVR